jgi:Rubisco Assembly chaperone C-terminal domain
MSMTSHQAGSLHGQNACFLPLKQLDQDSYVPRIVQIAGAYPGITKEEYYAVQSEPSPPQGQWTYDFSDPDGPQLGTVALDGSNVVAACEDPVVIIAEHFALGVELPKEITEPVDLICLVDRSKNRFGQRKFLVLNTADDEIVIRAFETKADLPAGCEILGQVEVVQIPWLPSMAPTKTGFLEADEYF